MNRKAQQLELEEAIALTQTARDQGHEYFRNHKDLMLVEVARHASTLFPDSSSLQAAYLQGYVRERQQHEAWQEGE